jgi:hypothetical protein
MIDIVYEILWMMIVFLLIPRMLNICASGIRLIHIWISLIHLTQYFIFQVPAECVALSFIQTVFRSP